MNNIIDFGTRIFNSNFRRLDYPYKVTFALTYRCNFRCQRCRVWEKSAKDEMTTEEIQQFFEKNNKFNWIDLTGGEIFLRDDLQAIALSILKNCKNLYLLHFPTNGWHTEKILSFVENVVNKNSGRLVVSISIDGPRQIHDDLRGTKNSWENAVVSLRALRKIKSRNLKVFVGVTVSNQNRNVLCETFEEIKEEVPEIQRKDFHFNLAHKSFHFYGNEKINLILNKESVEAIHNFMKGNRIFSPVSFLEHRYQKLCNSYIQTQMTPVSCQALSASVFIDPYGNIFPCASWNERLANLRDIDYDLRKVWHANAVKDTQRKAKSKTCPGCWTPCEAYQSILGNLFSKEIIFCRNPQEKR